MEAIVQKTKTISLINPSSRAKRWARLLDHALHHLGDRSALNSNPLSRIKCVREIAAMKYAQKTLPNGLALQQLIFESVGRLTSDLAGDRVFSRTCKFLELCCKGLTRRQISRELGLSREYVCRTIRPQALELLAQAIIDASHQSAKQYSYHNKPAGH